MGSPKLSRVLTDLGLSEKEAEIYLSSLSLGPSKITKIASAANVKRPTTYSIIESLRAKGLMSVDVRGFKNLYVATSPEQLEVMLDMKRLALRDSLGEFMALYNMHGGSSSLRCYNGIEGVRRVYEDNFKRLKRNDAYLAISDQSKWLALDPEYFKEFKLRRAKKGVVSRLLLTDSPPARENIKHQKMYNEEVKLLPKLTKLSTNLVITPWSVVIHQTVPPVMAILIEHAPIVQMHREYFEVMWAAV